MTTAPPIPAPPQGPGVHPPFPAPPVEGKGRRIGLSLGIGAAVLVLICGGGGVALAGLVASGEGAIQERARAAVRGYLDAVHDKQYERAYGLLCDQAQQEESPGDFRLRISREPVIESYELGDFDLISGAVPVDATYADGDTGQLEAYLGQDRSTGEFEVCELAE
jgi:hypothetical protein